MQINAKCNASNPDSCEEARQVAEHLGHPHSPSFLHPFYKFLCLFHKFLHTSDQLTYTLTKLSESLREASVKSPKKEVKCDTSMQKSEKEAG